MLRNETSTKRRVRRGPVLVVAGDRHIMASLRHSLSSLGYDSISGAQTHAQGLERMQTRTFSLVVFEASATNIPVRDFVIAVRRLDEESTLVAISATPRIDDVFELLRVGTRSFLVTPFTTQTLEEVIRRAVLGPPFSDAILDAADRDGALAALVLNNLYRLAVSMRHARDFALSMGNIDQYRTAFLESVELARLLSLGGDRVLQQKIVDACIVRGQTAASRLGRTRRRLQIQRVQSKPEGAGKRSG